jgi:copper chaperone
MSHSNLFCLIVEGMHCGGCVKRVKKALEETPGVDVKSVEIGRVTGMIDPGVVSIGLLLETLSKAGYAAKIGELG